MRPLAAISWSGGKDSCAALQRTREAFDVVAMLTMFDEERLRSRSHGLRPEVLAAAVLGTALAYMSDDMLNLAVPSVARDFGATMTDARQGRTPISRLEEVPT